MASVWPAAHATHLFDDAEAFQRWWEEAPWRVRVTDAGDAAVVDRWRRHLDLLAVRGLWAPTRRVRPLLEDLRELAADRGFGALLGPLVPEDAIGPYVAAGMEIAQRVIVCRMQPAVPRAASAPEGITLRAAGSDDLASVTAVDAACFDDFWRYDQDSIREYAAAERLVVAEREGRVIGYTLSTLRGAEATVGRLAVVAEERGAGVGSALMNEAVARAAENGAAAVTLCTQDDNAAARGLYRGLGFRELRGRLVAAVTPR